jgi:hypothetical protein
MVSGSISFPSRGAFHLSLTVLVHYRSPGYLALGSGLPRFPAGSSCLLVLRCPTAVHDGFGYGVVTLYDRPFQARSPTTWFGNCMRVLPSLHWVLQHPLCNAGRLSYTQMGLGCSRFVRHYYGNCFFSSGYLDVSVPPLASLVKRVPLYREGVAPFGNLRIGQKATPRSLSQRIHVLLRPWLPRHPPYALSRLSQLSPYFAPLLYTFLYVGWAFSI